MRKPEKAVHMIMLHLLGSPLAIKENVAQKNPFHQLCKIILPLQNAKASTFYKTTTNIVTELGERERSLR